MPFADYDSFEACTRDHADKRDPGAYCAEIFKQVKGHYPGQKSAADVYDDPETCVKYSLEAMKAVGEPPSEDAMAAISRKAQSVAEVGAE